MLRELHIKDIAIIEELRAEFSDGFNVFTGETGAGKSIIIGALGLCLGEKFLPHDIRTGAPEGCIEATFPLPENAEALKNATKYGIPVENSELIIRRVIMGTGKSRAHINGSPVTLSVLKAMGDSLLDIHGQHQHQQLLHQENHLNILDEYGLLLPLRAGIEDGYAHLQDVEAKLLLLKETERNRYRTQDLLNYQVREIEGARLLLNEDVQLERECVILQNAEKLYEASSTAYSMLYESEGSASELIAKALSQVERITKLDPQMSEVQQEGKASLYQIKDIAERLREYRDKISFDPAKLARIQERLELIKDVKKKYGPTIEEVLAFRENALSQLSALESCRQEIERLEQERAKLQKNLSSWCAGLSQKRREAASRLEEEAKKELSGLNMSGAVLHINLAQSPDPEGFVEHEGRKLRLHPWGIDKAEFLISTNPGEELKPLSRIASGGEVARIMLALKGILAEVDRIDTLIFDEVDAGIGGSVAEAVGRKLKALARKRQVFCVTHLPQIAAMASHHYCIEKATQEGRNITTLRKLSSHERLKEIGRMSAGEKVTPATITHARELLKGKSE